MELEVSVPMSREQKHLLRLLAARRKQPLCRVLASFIPWHQIARAAKQSLALEDEDVPRPRRRRPSAEESPSPAHAESEAEQQIRTTILNGGVLRDRRLG